MVTVVQRVKVVVRAAARQLARGLNALSGGRLTPNAVTWLGLLLHGIIAYCIITDQWLLAGVLLIIFGLFDTLDGELARLQGRESDRGGFLDASTDRIKEVVLYTAIAYTFAMSDEPRWAALAVVACGMSICVSFVKAKGETIIASKGAKRSYAELNRLFGGGLFPFEVRMAVLVLGLLTGYLAVALGVIAAGATYTTFQRLAVISRQL